MPAIVKKIISWLLASKYPQASLCYRTHYIWIKKGEVPEKYTRIIPYISGSRVLEIGSAEGAQALLLSRTKDQVYALEASPYRHQLAVELKKTWKNKGFDVDRCELINGNIINRLDLLDDIDTVLAVRCIYYFKEATDFIFKAISEKVKNVVLCGNVHRKLSGYDYYASQKGMVDILNRYGYKITDVVFEEDPIVVGKKIFHN